MDAAELVVKLKADTSGYARELQSAQSATGGLHSAASSLGSTLAKTLGPAALAAGAVAGVAKLGGFLKEAAADAMADQKAQEVLHTSIRNVTGATEEQLAALDKYIEKTQAATGFTEEDLRAAMTKLTAATKDTGEAQKLLGIAMDTATARGADLSTVTMALEKAQNGSLGGLQRLGVATKDAAGNALSYDQILQNLAATYSGATAAAADTMAGKMERAKLMFGEIKESLGAALMPVLEQFASFVMENMPAIEKLFTTVGEAFGALAPLIGGVLDIFTGVISTIVSLISGDWAGAWESCKSIFSSAWEGMKGLFGPIWDGIKGALSAGLDFIKGIWDTVWGAVSGFFSEVWNGIKDTAETIWNGIKATAETIWNGISAFFSTIWDIIKGIFTGNFGDLQGIVDTKMAGINDAIRNVFTSVKDFFVRVWTEIKDFFSGVWDGMKDTWDTAAAWIRDIPNKIKGFFSGAKDWLFDIGKEIIQGLWDGLKAMWSSVTGWFSGIGSWIAEHKGPIQKDRALLVPAGRAIMEGLQRGIESQVPALGKLMADISAGVTVNPAAVRGAGAMTAAGAPGRAGTYIAGGITVYITGQGTAAGEAAADALIRRLAAAGVRI